MPKENIKEAGAKNPDIHSLLNSLQLMSNTLQEMEKYEGDDQSKKLSRKGKNDIFSKFISILKLYPYVVEKFDWGPFLSCLRTYCTDQDTNIRSYCLRLLRYMSLSSNLLKLVLGYTLHLYIVRSLERDNKCLSERMQALKLIQRMIKVDAGQIPAYVVRSLVAISSHKDDSFRRLCLEILRELSLVNCHIVAECDGIKALLLPVLDPSCQDLAESLIFTILFLMNNPINRQYIRSSLDLQILLAPFTDTDTPPGNERRQKWTASKEAIIAMSRSWQGIIFLASVPSGLRSLIQLLEHPVGEDVKKAVLDIVCEILNMPPPFEKNRCDSTAFLLAGTPYDPLNTKNLCYSHITSASGCSISIPPHNMLDNYIVVVLLALIHCGILDALTRLGIGNNRSIGRASIDILSEILRLSSRLLPQDHCAKLLALPSLVDIACTITTKNKRSLHTNDTDPLFMHGYEETAVSDRVRAIRSSEMLSELVEAIGNNINSITGAKQSTYVNGVHMASEILLGTNRPLYPETSSSSLHETSRERIVNELKASLDAHMDDATFKDMLYHRSRVLVVKDWFKWDWDIITELLEGPLMNPLRLSEAMKTKFFHRLSGFFRCDPGNKGYFAQLPWVPDYVPYIRPACQMYSLLLNHSEGLQFLKTDRRGQLLSEIASALELEARPEAAIVESHIGALQARMFSPEFCSRRMLREYFTLLGLMSASKEGLRLLEQSNLFQRLYQMGKTQGHDFLCRLILANLDYTVDGSSRNLLQLWMTDGSKSLRLYATCLLRALLRSNVADFESWGIDILVTQLYQEEEVAEAALSVLEEAALTPRYLLAMILKRPQKLISLSCGKNLLLKFLSLPEGLAFLREMNWIPPMLNLWKNEKCISYAYTVEQKLSRCLNQDFGYHQSNRNLHSTSPVPLPVMVPMGKRGIFNPENHQTHWGLEWLFRLPWNMEVKIVGPPGSGSPTNLTLDTFVDASKMKKDREHSNMESDLIRVKGIIVDARNIPQPIVVNSQQTLQACLFLGTQPVDRRGQTNPPPQGNGGFVLSQSGRGNDNNNNNNKQPTNNSSNINNIEKPASNSQTVSSDLYGHGLDSEDHKDWSTCHPEQRLFSSSSSSSECFVCAPGERALWRFKVEYHKKEDDIKRLKRVWLKSVEFTLKLLPEKSPNVPLPSHLYGELSKTNFGCEIIRKSGHVYELINSLRDPNVIPIEKRAVLWALGHIASTSRGYEMIKRAADDFLDIILDMATNSPLLSLRGTCFYVLGLISRSTPGRRILNSKGWDCLKDVRSTIVVPKDLNQLFHLDNISYAGSCAVLNEYSITSIPLPPLKNEWKDVLHLIGNLSCHITQKEAYASLGQLKISKPEIFQDIELLLHVYHLFEKYNFRLPVRQYIHNLFEKALLNNIKWKNIEDHLQDPNYINTNKHVGRKSQSFTGNLDRNRTILSSSSSLIDENVQRRASVTGLVNNMHKSNVIKKEDLIETISLSSNQYESKRSKFNREMVEFIGLPQALV